MMIEIKKFRVFVIHHMHVLQKQFHQNQTSNKISSNIKNEKGVMTAKGK